MSELINLALKMTDSKFRDQDVLNAHFKDEWMSLDLEPSEERNNLPLTRMNNPSVVHFTGPASPSMAEVLNPYVQPPTSKPWGYLGSPGHPYEHAWQNVLDRTPWKGLQSSEAGKNGYVVDIERVIQAGVHNFQEAVARYQGA